MTYSSLENLKTIIAHQHLINLTNDKPANEINEDCINEALKYADEFINAYLRNKYKLPLQFVPELIVRLATDISAYRLYSRRPNDVPKHIQNNYDEAKKILTNLQKAQMSLDLPSEHPDKNVNAASRMIMTNKTRESRIFSDELFKEFGL